MSRPGHRRGVQIRTAAVAHATCLLLCACGSGQHASLTGSTSPSAARPKLTLKAADSIDPDMVSAVSPGGQALVGLKFRIKSRPVVGAPVEIDIALLPAADISITHLRVAFRAGDGLQLDTDRVMDVDDPRAGVPLEQTLSVVPQQEGVLSLGATVSIDQDSGTTVRSYAIPLIASSSTS